MTIQTQQYVRLIVPGVLAYFLVIIVCRTTEWCDLPAPTSVTEVTKLLAAIALGALYRVSGLRELSNKCYHADVNSRIIHNLTQPFRDRINGVGQLTWRQVRTVFYYFIDRDESLKTQAARARFNGVLWTSSADLRVVSFVGILALSASMICSQLFAPLWYDVNRAAWPILCFALIFLASFWISGRLTNEHVEIGDQQADYIIQHYREALEAKLRDLLG